MLAAQTPLDNISKQFSVFYITSKSLDFLHHLIIPRFGVVLVRDRFNLFRDVIRWSLAFSLASLTSSGVTCGTGSEVQINNDDEW